ncbi:hypothetical protein G7Y79_00021g049690 [Physcia stellaris]|nr:hypothetical protein G7Y79_00021g049690 [Physcia stellaris]
METGSNSNNEGRITHNHDAFLRSLRNPQIGSESQLALLRVFIAGLPRAPMDEPPADESDQKCAVCRESLWPSGETEPSEVALKLDCCGRFIGENCLKTWLSPHSEGGGGGHTCPFCRKQLIDRWPLIEPTPPLPRVGLVTRRAYHSMALWRAVQSSADERGEPLFDDELLGFPRGRHNFDGLHWPAYDGESPARAHNGHNDDSLRNRQDLENGLPVATARPGRNDDELFLETRAYAESSSQVASMRELLQTAETDFQSAHEDIRTVEADLQSARQDLEPISERHQPVQAGTPLTTAHHDGDEELPDGEPLMFIVFLLVVIWFNFVVYTPR